MPTLPPGVKPINLSEQATQMAEGRLPLSQRISNAWAALIGGERPFGPNQPLQPLTGQDNQPITDPRQYRYQPGVNLILSPRREQTAGPDLTTFEQLRNLASLYDIAAMCISTRIEEIQGLDWSVVPKDKRRKDLKDECEAATAFFERPDRVNDWTAWISTLLYELFVTDALTLFPRQDRSGRLYSLEPIDGTTIKPLIDERGRTVSYQQILYGYPESEYSRDIDPVKPGNVFGLNELIYRPRWPRVYSPYGSPPTEWIILRVNTALRKQTSDLSWFTDGNIPEGIATAPDMMANPEQVRQFENDFNAVLAGDDAARRKLRFIPWKFDFHEFRPFSYDTALDNWMMLVTCAAYSVQQQELGFTMDINKATGEVQEAIHERRGLKPLITWLKRTILDPQIHRLEVERTGSLSLPGEPTRPATNPLKLIEFAWNLGGTTDELTQAQTDHIRIMDGIVTPDEIRTTRYGDELDGKAPGIPQQANPFGAPAPNPAQPPAVEAPVVKFFQGGYRPEGLERV